MQPKIYITDDHLLMDLIRSIYYNIKYEITNNNPDTISKNGYQKEDFLLQRGHLPPFIRKGIRGINS